MCLVETKGFIGIRYTLSATTTVLATQQHRQGSQMVHHIILQV